MKPVCINYSAAYSFADEIIMTVRNPERLGSVDIVGDFLEFRTPMFFECISKPQKWTLLHQFIYNVNSFPIDHYVGKVDAECIIQDFGPLLDGAMIARPNWFNVCEVEEHIYELRGLLDSACKYIAEAAFQLLYPNRTFLFEFNMLLARYIAFLQPGEHPCIVATGKVSRCYFPVWLKNAVFLRDKGICQLCGCDLTNVLVPTEQRNIDHMVPLNSSGTNDPTNFQLTCESCNKSKGATVHAEPHLSFPFW
ncbi:HNH endonuclease [Vibrio cholerae]|uniref:HNH endonuclease n=1 Tax=Vibrio cholerae TaxID=666 RepID=UPI0011D5F4F0|nr:HNH endonuclease signature motif containing protein [Vibrio cholerae]TXZ85168.1 HNH endonuclease [Vibrio cholerae]TYA90697.1 HNH endonuclease [Vibrio cholerae]